MPAGMKKKFAIRLVLMVALGLLSAFAVGAWVSPGTTSNVAEVIWTIGGGGH
ncbi:MAG: hypothetical protein ACM30G_08980 [Micromonosporaceae bacterium]